jgi:hypothetical protein
MAETWLLAVPVQLGVAAAAVQASVFLETYTWLTKIVDFL